MTFPCPQCSKTFHFKTRWVRHLEREHGLAPVQVDPMKTDLSGAIELGTNMSAPSMSAPETTSPALEDCVEPQVRSFSIEFDLGLGDGVQPFRTSIPWDESYDNFTRRLDGIFCRESFENSLHHLEYVLVSSGYEKGNPRQLSTPNTYYAMVSELMTPKSRWRHAAVRRSVSGMQ